MMQEHKVEQNPQEISFEQIINETLTGNESQLETCLEYFKKINNRISSIELTWMLDRFNETLNENPNNVNALFLYGRLYLLGLYFRKDYTQARTLFKKTVALGHVRSMIWLAGMYHQGFGGEVNLFEARALSRRAAELGDRSAIHFYALMCRDGQGGETDFDQAASLLKRAISFGNTDAMFFRADMHRKGQGGKVNDAAAKDLYKQAIALGCRYSMIARADMHRDAKEFDQAILLYQDAISLGSRDAMSRRADMYAQGQGGPVNIAAAREYYERAIALKCPYAMQDRGIMYKEGLGEPVNRAAAAKLFRRSMEQSSPNKIVWSYFRHFFDLQQKHVACHQLKLLIWQEPKDFTEIRYHGVMVGLYDERWERNPVQFLKFLSQDDLLNNKRRLFFVGKVVSKFPKIASSLDQACIDLIGDYYYQRIADIFGNEFRLKDNTEQQLVFIYEAIALLNKIPLRAKRRGEACYDVALHLFQCRDAATDSIIAPLEKARIYFKSGIESHQHAECEHQYSMALERVLEINDSKMALDHHTDRDSYLQTLETEYTKIKSQRLQAIILNIPTALDQAMLVLNSQKRKKNPSFFATWGDYSQKKFDTFRAKILHLFKEDELLEKAALNEVEFKTLADRYSEVLLKEKKRVDSGILYESLRSIEQCIHALQPERFEQYTKSTEGELSPASQMPKKN